MRGDASRGAVIGRSGEGTDGQTFKSAARIAAVHALVCRASIIKGRFERRLIMHQISKLTRPLVKASHVVSGSNKLY